ncbi:MAG: nucleotidyltransferase domain-containing protein [Candidatus Lokiarchaeota archaeon]
MEQKNIRLSRQVLEKHRKEIKKLNEFLDKILELLKEKIISIVLIGSRARFDFNIGSDIDLIIIGTWSEKILFNRINEIKEIIQLPLLPIDICLYTPEEIIQLIDQGNPLILDGFIEGTCLFNQKYYDQIHNEIKNRISRGSLSKVKELWKVKY